MYRILISSIALCLFTACGNSEAPREEAGQATAAPAVSYASVPLDTLTMLFEQCELIDYIFYNMEFSVSQNDKAAIQNALSHISDEVPTVNPNCRANGHLFYQVAGETRLEGDFYVQPDCTYFVFYKDGKPAYANKMTAGGLQFFQTIITRVQSSRQGG